MSLRVAYQGIAGAYSELAGERFCARAKLKVAAFVPCAGFDEVFAFAEKRGWGIVPVENSLTGSVHPNFDLLGEHRVAVKGEWVLGIEHELLAAKGATLRGIRTVYSHPQALSQCRTYLEKLAKVEVVPYFDTAGAARHVQELGRKDVAAVAGAPARKKYGLAALARGIQDRPGNFTRFLVIGPRERATGTLRARAGAGGGAGAANKATIAITCGDAGIGSCLAALEVAGSQILRVEARPTRTAWSYRYVADVKLPRGGEAPFRAAVASLGGMGAEAVVLGAYRAATAPK